MVAQPHDLLPYAISSEQLELDETVRQLDIVRLAVFNAADKRQQAEEERDAAKTDFAAIDYLVQQACEAAGATRMELLVSRINEIKAERDRAQQLSRTLFADRDANRNPCGVCGVDPTIAKLAGRVAELENRFLDRLEGR